MFNSIVRMYVRHRLPRAAAGLSYYMTMTFFPLVICLYALFGQNYFTAMRVFGFIEHFLTPDAANMIREYLLYVAGSSGRGILVAAVTILIMSASAAVRALVTTIADIQGGRRFHGWVEFLISFPMAVILLLAMYFSLLVVLTGHDVVVLIRQALPSLGLSFSWTRMRFVSLGCVAFLLFWGVFALSKNGRYRTWPGAAFSAVGTVGMSFIFSAFIAASAQYSLVYGSLASLILMMLWLFLASQIILIGVALNVALRDRAKSAAAAVEEPR